jgi:hypothetical protein
VSKKETFVCGLDDKYGYIYCDLSRKQRYVIDELDGYFAIRDRAADGEYCWHHPVRGIPTREDAEELATTKSISPGLHST